LLQGNQKRGIIVLSESQVSTPTSTNKLSPRRPRGYQLILVDATPERVSVWKKMRFKNKQ